MFMAFIIILFVIVLSKCSSCSEDRRELQEEPITPIAPIERLTNTTLLYEGERSFMLGAHWRNLLKKSAIRAILLMQNSPVCGG